MFKFVPKSKYPPGMLYFLTEHTLIIYVQNIKGSKRKTSYLLETLFEKDLVHFVSDSIFKRLKGSLTLAMGKCLWFSVKIKVCQSSLSSP